jgi:hypothetical protein
MTTRASSLPARLSMLAIAVFATVAATLGVAASARAADATVSVSFDGHLRGVAAFRGIGDWLEICDERRDGLPVAVRYSYIRKNGTVQRGTHFHTAGVGGLGNPGFLGLRSPGCSFGNHNFGEGRRVWIQACVQHGDGTETCSKTQVTRA